MKNKKICITGANGFVGTNLTKELVKRGYEVTCLVRKTSDISFIEDLPVEIIRADYNSQESIKAALKNNDYLFHLAAKVRAKSENEFDQSNYELTRNLVKISERASLKKFIFLSTQAAAGPAKDLHLKTENENCFPISLYGKSKLKAENYLKDKARIPYTIIRSVSVFGPYDTDFLTVFKMIKNGIKIKCGFKEKFISLIYVKDLVKLLIMAAENKKANGEIFFACDGRTYSRQYFLDEIASAMNKSTLNIPVPMPILYSTALWNEIKQNFADKPYILNLEKAKEIKERFWLCSNDKARKILDFKPDYNLFQALKETYKWYKEQEWL